jgi:hypothetical protein
MATVVAADSSTDIWAVANHPVLWIFALGVFAVIFVQSFIYIKAARKAGPDVGVQREDLTRAFRSGAVASIGPSLAVVIVAIALLALFGTPAVLVRIGLIGSAATETASAQIAATTMGTTLGGEGYNQQVFAVAFAAMSISGGAWMLATVILTPLLKRGGAKLSVVNPLMMALIPGAALLGAFSVLTISEVPKSWIHAVTVVVSALVMAGLLVVARRYHVHWLKEWALGISILAALAVAFVAHSSTLAAA